MYRKAHENDNADLPGLDPAFTAYTDAERAQMKKDPFYLKLRDGTPIMPLRQKITDYNQYAMKMPTVLMPRPGFSTAGRPAQVAINSHKVLDFPTKTVYQYDVSKHVEHKPKEIYRLILHH